MSTCVCGCLSHTRRTRTVRRASPHVNVVYQGRAASIDLRRLRATRADAMQLVSLADLWVASQLPGEMIDLGFDVVGDDGFRVSEKCTAPIRADLLVHGKLEIATRNLVRSAKLPLPCFFRVKAVSVIQAADIA